MYLSLTKEKNLSSLVECPSVCCEYELLLLADEQCCFAYGRAEYSEVGNPSRDTARKKADSEGDVSSHWRSKMC